MKTPATNDTTSPRRLRRRLISVGAGAAVALAAAGGIAATGLPVAPAMAATAATHSTAHPCAVVLWEVRRAYDRLPSSMSSAIAAADHASSTDARKDARKAVLEKAQGGAYGSEVEAVAAKAKTLVGFRMRWDRLPSSLREALDADRGATGATRQSDLTTLLSKAESGAYGTRVDDAVTPLASRFRTCIAKIGDAPTAPATGTPAPSPTATTGA